MKFWTRLVSQLRLSFYTPGSWRAAGGTVEGEVPSTFRLQKLHPKLELVHPIADQKVIEGTKSLFRWSNQKCSRSNDLSTLLASKLVDRWEACNGRALRHIHVTSAHMKCALYAMLGGWSAHN